MPLPAEAPSALPPVPDHDFKEGDQVSMPLRGKRIIRGVLTHIDVYVGRSRYCGLALLGEDSRYYEFHPELSRKL